MNKESYSYYKKAYRANKRYREKIHSDDFGPMLSKSDFEDMKNTGLSTKDIVYNQFHCYTRSAAKKIQASIRNEGVNVSLANVQKRKFSPEVYDKIGKTYHELREGLSSKDALALISYTFYGS